MLSELIDPDMPGYVIARVNGTDVPGIFTRAFVETNRISGNRPLLTIVDTAVIAINDAVVISAKNYTVAELQPDGDGFIEVILNG